MMTFREPAPAPAPPTEKIFPHQSSRTGHCPMCGADLNGAGVSWLIVEAVKGRDDVVSVKHVPTKGGEWACGGAWLMRPRYWRDPNAPKFNPTWLFGAAFLGDMLWHLIEWGLS